MDKIRVPTSKAMKIGGLSNIKFNEAVHRNYYQPRNPEIVGRSRMFDEYDLFGLFVMGNLLKMGLNLPLAASRALGARWVLEGHPKAKSIWINNGPNADSVWNDGIPKGDKPEMSIVFHVDQFRKKIESEIEKPQADD